MSAKRPALEPRESSQAALEAENADLRARLTEANETLHAIRTGEVEALVVEGAGGPQVFTLTSAEAASNSLRGEMLTQVTDAVIAVDPAGRLTYLNAAAERLYGVPARTALGQSVDVLYQCTWLAPGDAAAAEAALAATGTWRGESLHRTGDGRLLRVESCVTRLTDAGRASGGLLTVNRDITARHEAEAQLREHDRFVGEITAVVPGIMYVYDVAERRNIFINRQCEAVLGYPAEVLQALPAGRQAELIHPDDHPAIRAHVAHLALLPEGVAHEVEYRFRHPQTGWRWLLSRDVVYERGAAGRIRLVLGVGTDITARKAAELELRRAADLLRGHQERLEQVVAERTAELETSHARLRLSERLAAIGTLATGLGHDMGNLLMPLRVRLHALEQMGLPEAARPELEAIGTTAEYLRRLAAGLKLLALDPRATEGGRARTELAPWWADTEAMLRNGLPRSVSFTAQLDGCLDGAVQMSRAALTQAVFNLVQNAGDAIGLGREGRVHLTCALEGAQLVLAVSDTGPGMPPEVQRRCMEPFFTTKARGISTGLGLSLVYGLVTEAGGTVELVSAPGEGTTFTLRLPLAPPEPEPVMPPRRAVVAMEDERLRAYVTAELRRLHYEVARDVSAAAGADLLVVDDPAWVPNGGRLVVLPRRARVAEVREVLLGALGETR